MSRNNCDSAYSQRTALKHRLKLLFQCHFVILFSHFTSIPVIRFISMQYASTSSLYAHQQRLLCECSLQSLASSVGSTSHQSLVHIPPIEVNHFSNCPNIHCTIPVPHTYYHNVVEACPSHIPILLLQCFSPDLNPFPNNIQYKVFEAPSVLLEHGFQVYVIGLGVVRLPEIAVNTTGRSDRWRVFQCIREGQIVVAEIAVRKEWSRIPEKCFSTCGVFLSFFRSFFH